MLAQDAMNADPIVVALEVHVQQLVVDANDHADPIAGHDRVGAATPTRLVLLVHKLARPADSSFPKIALKRRDDRGVDFGTGL
jgi:hypothetical protein